MKPTTGTALGGRYRLDRLIAVGGMGEVWVAHDLSLRRDVAVKVLREEFAGDAGFLERFRTEARNAASLSHPNIAATYDYGEQSGSSYLVMELVPGEPLSDLLEREPTLPERRLLPVLAQTARALHAAHLAGVVHRDVKPGNILLGPGGRVKITDFGVSTTPDQAHLTATGMVMGTAQYLSPEQAVGRPATPSSDLYSLGVVAYEALAGRRPFTGPTAVDIAVAHVNDPVPPLPRTVSAPVADLVRRLLAKDPADRPPSAAALARTLDAMVGHTPPDGVPLPDDDAVGTSSAGGAGRPARDPVPTAHPGAHPAGRPDPAGQPHPAERPDPAGRPDPAAGPGPAERPDPAGRPDPAAGPGPAERPAPRDERPPSARPGPGVTRPGGPASSAPPSFPPRRVVPDPRRPVASEPVPARTAAAPDRPPREGHVPPRGRLAPSTRTGTAPGRGPTPDPRPSPGARLASGTRPAAPVHDRPAPRPAGGASTAAQPTRTSTTTGRRLGRVGRWSWPLVVLVGLLVALLLAAVTDSVGAAGQGVATTASASPCPVPTAPARPQDGGMIVPCAPSAGPAATTPPTPKDA